MLGGTDANEMSEEMPAVPNRTVGWALLVALPPVIFATLVGVVTFFALWLGIAAWAVSFAAHWVSQAVQAVLS